LEQASSLVVVAARMGKNRRYITLPAAIVELLGQSARPSWSSRSWYYLFFVYDHHAIGQEAEGESHLVRPS
jgi:hypothetical protein